MHGDSLAARYISHDALASDRIAALGAIDQQVVDAFHLDDQVASLGACQTSSSRRRSGFGRLRRE